MKKEPPRISLSIFDSRGDLKEGVRLLALKLSCVAAIGSCLLASPSLNAAEAIWKGDGLGGNGPWSGDSSWSINEPDSTFDALFKKDAVYTSANSEISIAEAAVANRLKVGRGKGVTLDLGDEASLSAIGNTTIIGAAVDTNTGVAGSLIINGPETGNSTVTFRDFYVGGEATSADGNSLTFSGNVAVTASGPYSAVGRFANNNTLSIVGGAKASLSSLYVSHLISGAGTQVGQGRGNGIVVSGAGSSLTTSAITTIGNSSDLGSTAEVSTLTNEQRYQRGAQGNSIKVLDGATAKVSFNGTHGIGGGVAAHSNSIEVSGTGSSMELSGEWRIGESAGTSNLGGNSIKVSGGGAVTANGAININRYDQNGGFNDGANRVVIGAGGTFNSNSSIHNNGLVQLAATGKLVGGTHNVNNGARFEAAGTGLSATTTTSVKSGGALAVGLSGDLAPVVLSLSGAANKTTLLTGAILEIGIFGGDQSDQINFASGGAMTVQSGVTLRLTLEGYTLVGGESWSLFTGATTSGLSGTSSTNMAAALFDLPTLAGGLAWDMTNFNEGGQWVVAVAVPEPSSYALLVFTTSALGICYRKRKTANC